MIILSIETATMLGGVALLHTEEGLIAERRMNVKSTHSERLMPEMKDMIELAGLSVADLGAVAVSIGPGAFTGLRIGLATAKGLAMSQGLKLAPVPTLEAMAFCLPGMGAPVCTMLDARKGEVYAALYDTSSGMPRELIAPSALKAHVFAERIKENPNKHDKVLFMGQGALVYQDDIASVLGEAASIAPAHLMVPSPSAVASLGAVILKRGGLPDPVGLAPMYFRKSEAELKEPKGGK